MQARPTQTHVVRADSGKEEPIKTVIALLAGAVFVSSTGLAFAQEYPHAFPRPGATLLLENERVLVWEVVWPDGAPQVYHRHQYDMTGVFLR